tara:strand:+ start:85 stop:321 length:237 start_codon:yes stop_codon:yes gene_type:complete
MDIYEWKLSAKGNEYADIEGIHCVVGENKFGAFFGLVDEEFLPQALPSLDAAKQAVINHAKEIALNTSPFEEFFREEL